MAWKDDLRAEFRGALEDRIEVVDLKPEQKTVPVRLVIGVANGTVFVGNLETVQLKHDLAVPDQLLVFRTAMIAAAAEETLIPAAAGFDIGDGDERLGTHGFSLANPDAGWLAGCRSRWNEG